MQTRFYVADFSKKIKIDFVLGGASHAFIIDDDPGQNASRLYASGGAVRRTISDADEIRYLVAHETGSPFIVISAQIWVASLEVPAPIEPICRVTVRQVGDGELLKPYWPPVSGPGFTVTDTIGGPYQYKFVMPELVFSQEPLS